MSTLTTAKHTLVKAAALKWGDLPPCTLSIISDVPKGTGLGSSSALALALCELFAHDNVNHPGGLVQMAYALERTVSPVGLQDFLPGAWGGFRVYKIDTRGLVTHSLIDEPLAMQVDNNGLLLWTGQSREAAPILKKSWQKAERELEQIQNLAESVEQELPTMTLQRMGEMLDYSWQVKRKIGGVTTPEFDEQYAKAKEAGAIGGKVCFPKGTLIRTGTTEYEKVEDVSTLVLDHQAQNRIVLKKISRPYNGDLVSIRVKGLPREILVTPEHPFLLTKKRFSGKHVNFKLANVPIYIEAKDIRRGNTLLVPIDDEIHDLSFINARSIVDYVASKYANNNPWDSIPELLPVEYDLLNLVGWYAAEGSCGPKQINFALHQDEKEEAKEIVSAMANLFDKIATIQPNGKNTKGIRIVTSNVFLARLFPALCGRGSTHKHLPSFCEYLPIHKQAVVLRAMWRGDGCYVEKLDKRTGNNSTVCAFKSTSFKLAKQAQHLCHRLGYVTGLAKCDAHDNRKDTWIVSIHGEDAEAFKQFIETGNIVPVIRRNSKKLSLKKDIIEMDGTRYVKRSVMSVSRVPYIGDVYNFEVANAHTYIAEDIAVHNCGAGSGGCWFFLAPRSRHEDIIKATGLTPIHFSIEHQGSETSYV